MTQPQRLIVGLSGASGIVYGVRLLEALRGLPVEAHLVMSKSAELTLAYETDLKVAEVQAMADVWYPAGDMGAALASGSIPTELAGTFEDLGLPVVVKPACLGSSVGVDIVRDRGDLLPALEEALRRDRPVSCVPS